MKQWMEMAQNMSGGDFWKNVFDDEQLKSFQNGHSHFPFQQGDGQMRRNEDAFPLIDIVETHDELQFLLYLPGYRKQDVQLLSYGEYIVVKARENPFSMNRILNRRPENTAILKKTRSSAFRSWYEGNAGGIQRRDFIYIDC